MNNSNPSAEPVALIMAAKGTKLRAASLVLALISMFLPVLSTSAMGISQSANTLQLAGWAILSPLVIAAALAAPGVIAMQRYGQLLDIAAAAITVLVVLYIGYAIFDIQSQMGRATAGMGSIGANAAFGVSITPSFGLVTLLASAGILVFIVVSDNRDKLFNRAKA